MARQPAQKSRWARWREQYQAWIKREQAKNQRLKEKGDKDWEDVKQLWREHKEGR